MHPTIAYKKNKKPNSATLKARMQEWLEEKGIAFSREMTKAQLMELVKFVPDTKEYAVDDILKKHGHTGLRLPPYHPDLNPIELVWGYVKGKVGRECLSNKLEDKKVFLQKCFDEYTQEMWQQCCSHVKKAEEEYVKNDSILDERRDEIIINIGEGTSSDEDDDVVM